MTRVKSLKFSMKHRPVSERLCLVGKTGNWVKPLSYFTVGSRALRGYLLAWTFARFNTTITGVWHRRILNRFKLGKLKQSGFCLHLYLNSSLVIRKYIHCFIYVMDFYDKYLFISLRLWEKLIFLFLVVMKIFKNYKFF